MSLLESFFYGLVQAVTEFLPVSSSGHLALIPHFLQITDPGLAFDLSMHLGTAFAVMIYFYKDILFLCRSPYISNYILATIATVIPVFLLKALAEDYGRSPLFIAINLILFGWVLFYADKLGKKQKQSFKEHFYLKESLLIGLAQVLAIFPGVSRSGITISMGRVLGFDKERASAFSFLLSVPIIMGGVVLKFKELTSGGEAFDMNVLVVGVLSSFFLGLFVIHYFLKLVKKINFLYFALYRTVLGGVLLIIFLMQ